MLGFSYAFWVLNLIQSGENERVTSCFNVTFTDKNNINIEKAYPIQDEESKKLTPYEFTIMNTCDSYVAYRVNLDILKTSTLTNYNAVKTMVSDKKAETENLLLLAFLSHQEVTSKNASTTYNLTTGYLDSKGSKTHTLRLCVLAVPEGVQETLFSSKVVVTTSSADALPDYFCEVNPDISGNVKVFYGYERSNDTVVRTTSWTRKIGLIYLSDYGYATSGDATSN